MIVLEPFTLGLARNFSFFLALSLEIPVYLKNHSVSLQMPRWLNKNIDILKMGVELMKYLKIQVVLNSSKKTSLSKTFEPSTACQRHLQSY